MIVFHKPSEWERFQTRIGRWSIEDVSATIASNKTREAYGSREDTITLTLPADPDRNVTYPALTPRTRTWGGAPSPQS